MKSLELILCAVLFYCITISVSASALDSLKSVLDTDIEPLKRAEVYLELGNYWKNENVNKAFDCYYKSCELAKDVGDEVVVAKAHLGIGIIKEKMDEFDSAKIYYDLALNTFRDKDLKTEQGRVFNSVGLLYYYKGKYNDALTAINRGLQLNSIKQDTLLQVMLNNNKSLVLKKIGNYEGALKCGLDALWAAKELNDSLGLTKLQGNIGLLYERLGKHDEAISFFNKSLKIREEMGCRKGLAYPLHNLGLVYEQKGDYYKALMYYQKSLEIKQEFNEKRGIARSYNNIGIIYKNLGQYKKSIKSYEQALQIKTEIGLVGEIPHTLNNLGTVYLKIDHKDTSLKYFSEAVDSTRYGVPAREKLRAYTGMYQCYKEKKQFDKALDCHEKVNEIKSKLVNESSAMELTRLETMYNLQEFELENEHLQQETALMKSRVRLQYFFAVVLVVCLFMVVIIAVVLNQKKKEREASNEKLMAVNRQLQSLTKFKDTMTSMIVHDLKNPLNTIMNMVSLEGFAQKEAHIKDSAYRMLNLVNNIMDVNRYENDQIVLQKEQFSFNELVHVAFEELDFFASSRNISLVSQQYESCDIIGDQQIIKRALVNIISNAIKYSSLNKDVVVKAFSLKEGMLKCVITNQGKGIDAAVRDSIFDLYSGEHLPQGKIRSNGLGLTFCKIAIEAHGGQIGFNEDNPGYTDFWFTIPFVMKQSVFSDVNASQNFQEAILWQNGEKEMLADVHNALSGYEVFQVSEIQQAIQKAQIRNNRNIQKWLSYIEIAVSECNEVFYSELLEMAKN